MTLGPMHCYVTYDKVDCPACTKSSWNPGMPAVVIVLLNLAMFVFAVVFVCVKYLR